MDNKNLIRIEIAFAYIFCAFTLLCMISLTVDLFQFISNPSDYAKVYQNDLGDNAWIKDYIIQELILIICCILIFGLSLWRLIKPNKILRLSIIFVYLVIVLAALTGIYKWYLIGFDHT